MNEQTEFKYLRKTVTLLDGQATAQFTIDKEDGFDVLEAMQLIKLSGTFPVTYPNISFVRQIGGRYILYAVKAHGFMTDSNVPWEDRFQRMGEVITGERILVELDATIPATGDIVLQLITKWKRSNTNNMPKQHIQSDLVIVASGTKLYEPTIKLAAGYEKLVGIRVYDVSGSQKLDIGINTHNGTILRDPVYKDAFIASTNVAPKDRMVEMNIPKPSEGLKLYIRSTDGTATSGEHQFMFEFILE